jgi:phasin family protein
MTDTTTKKIDVKTIAEDVKGKAQAAYAKGTAVAGEFGTMTKGNVDAVVASGKILGAGIKELGDVQVAQGKSAFETFVADIKALTAVTSPTEFFDLQSKIAKRNFDNAIALTSQNSKAVVKLATEVAAPLSTQVKVNVAKLRVAA